MHTIIKSNAIRKVIQLRNFIGKNDRVLDFGCGDLSLSKELHVRMPGLHIRGVDIVDFGIRDTHIAFQQYDGKTLPYRAGAFDTVIVYHVLHHTNNPANLLLECLRVSRKTVLLVEPVYRWQFEIFGMTCMDWLFNVWKEKSIAMTFAFRSRKQWEYTIRNAGWNIDQAIDVEILPKWFPSGRSYLLYAQKLKSA